MTQPCLSESVLKKEQDNAIAYHQADEAQVAEIIRVASKKGENQIADLLATPIEGTTCSLVLCHGKGFQKAVPPLVTKRDISVRQLCVIFMHFRQISVHDKRVRTSVHCMGTNSRHQ